MPRNDLPRYSIGLTFSEAQLDRIDEMIERYNATHADGKHQLIVDREQCISSGLIALEALLFDITDPNFRSVFEQA